MQDYTYVKIIDYYRSQNLQTKADYKSFLDHFSVLFAYNSGVIENQEITYHDTREIFENGKIINYTGNLKTLYEISNQKDCYDYLVDNIVLKTPISESFIKKIHKILTKGTYDEDRYVKNNERPGEYKKHDYVTGKNEIGSSVENVSKEIKELVEEINSVDSNDIETVFTLVAYAHNVFESIHPFADGNGRVGRVLMNYILMIHQLPPIIIYDEDKKFYYEALEKYDDSEDLSSTIKFFHYEMEKTWKKKLELIDAKKIQRKKLDELM